MGQPRNNEMRAKVCALYLEGKSVKDIGKIIGRNHSLAFKWVKQAGLLDAERKRNVFKPECHLRADFVAEQRILKCAEGHWGNHPEVKKWAGLRAYYSNHESNKEASKIRSKETYIRKIANPEWRTNRLRRHAAYMRANPHLRVEYLKRIKERDPNAIKRWRLNARRKPQNKVRNNLRRRLRDLIHGRVGMRSSELVGCNHAFLVQWLGKKFKRGMTWENYGTRWHVDHVIPCAAFRLEDKHQAKKCFHYSNLRPLWAAENMAKGDTIVATQPELCIAI